jgi:hypothetical protein
MGVCAQLNPLNKVLPLFKSYQVAAMLSVIVDLSVSLRIHTELILSRWTGFHDEVTKNFRAVAFLYDFRTASFPQ